MIFKAADSGIEYFKFLSDEWELLSTRDYPLNFTVSKYYRNQADGTWAQKPNGTLNSGTTGFVAELRFRRYAGYYNCNVMIPVLIIVAIGFFTVFLPPTGDKVNLAVTVLLGFLFLQGIIAQQVPKSAITPLLSLYVVCALLISTVNVAASSCVVAVNCLPEESQPPLLVRLIGVRFLGCILCSSPRKSFASFQLLSQAGINTVRNLRSSVRRHSSTRSSPTHVAASSAPGALPPNKSLKTNHTDKRSGISGRKELELHRLTTSSFNVSASSLVSRPSPITQADDGGAKSEPETEVVAGECELVEKPKNNSAADTRDADPTTRVRLLVSTDSQDSAEAEAQEERDRHVCTYKRAADNEPALLASEKGKGKALKGQTWQDFATVLNMYIHTEYYILLVHLHYYTKSNAGIAFTLSTFFGVITSLNCLFDLLKE